jgi:predicted secreted hydrolase
MFKNITLFLLLWLFPPLILSATLEKKPSEPNNNVSETKAFAKAIKPRHFTFPDDHLPHPPFQTEWWYFTGNLQHQDKQSPPRRFGYQFTLFRFAITPQMHQRESAWASRDIYMAHLALTDIAGKQFYNRERRARGGILGLAGVTFDNPQNKTGYRMWLEDWQVSSISPNSWLPLRIQTKEDNFSLDLQLETAKPIVLQGERGLSQKNAEQGNASYYYSMTRMPTQGQVTISDQSYQVQGMSWFDREWSTSSLNLEQGGWDWFSLQLDDGRDIMYYQLRLKNGEADNQYSTGMIVDKNGKTQRIEHQDVELIQLDEWQSPETKIDYPIKWQFNLPQLDLKLTITPYLKQQEWQTTVNYWEGTVSLSGYQGERKISGSGYLEMTGYNQNESIKN